VNITKDFAGATQWCDENVNNGLLTIKYTADVMEIVDNMSTCEGTLLLKHTSHNFMIFVVL